MSNGNGEEVERVKEETKAEQEEETVAATEGFSPEFTVPNEYGFPQYPTSLPPSGEGKDHPRLDIFGAAQNAQ